MKNEAMTIEPATTKLVNAQTLLESLFDERSRPTLRTLRTWTKTRIIPCVRCGGLVYYDIAQVRKALIDRCDGINKARQVAIGPGGKKSLTT